MKETQSCRIVAANAGDLDRKNASPLSRRDFIAAAGAAATGMALGASTAVSARERDPDALANAVPSTDRGESAVTKNIYLARRRPGFTHDEFVIRWRQHGTLAMSQSFFRENMKVYVQAEVLQPSPVTGASDDHDAVAYFIQPPNTTLTQRHMEELEFMALDEYETFDGAILPVILQVDEWVLKAGVPGGVTAFLFFVDPADAVPVAEHYRHVESTHRVVLNVRNEERTLGDMSSLIPYRAVVEVSACDLDLLGAVLGAGGRALWRSSDLAAITRECVLWDRVS